MRFVHLGSPTAVPTMLRSNGWLLACQIALAALVVAPSIAYVVFVSLYHENEMVWEIFMPISFIGACGLAGFLCHRIADRFGFRDWYRQRAAREMEYCLALSGIALAVLSLSLGMGVRYVSGPLPSPMAIFVLWMMMLAVLIPVDAAGLIPERWIAIILSALSAWACCAMYPAYLFGRPGGRKGWGWLAIVCVAAFFVGCIDWWDATGDLNSLWARARGKF